MPNMPQNKIHALDLFAGAGGMSIGAMAAGIQIDYAIEKDPQAAETYKRNHPNTKVIVDDIKDVDFSKISFPAKEPLIIFGGPPCQGFSTSNQKTRNKENKNNWLFNYFLRFTDYFKPDWVVFENVKGFKETAKGFFHKKVFENLEKMQYTVSSFILNAEDYGVPQRRYRLFIIGSKNGYKVTAPPLSRYRFTVWDAISDLPILENGASISRLPYSSRKCSKYAKKMRRNHLYCENNIVTKNSDSIVERYKYIPEGGNWQNIPEHLMGNYKNFHRCHTGIYHRLAADKPSLVVGNFRKNMMIHPKSNRGLSVREAARLQSFPDDYVFYGALGSQQQQVGNAVPPILAKAIFDEIVKYLS